MIFFLFVFLLSIFVIGVKIYPSMFTKISPRPEKSIGWLWVNPFVLKNHLGKFSDKYNSGSDLVKGWKIKFTDLGIGFYKMGETGIYYKCEQKGNSKTTLVSIDKNEFSSDKKIIAKRIYWSLLFCSVNAEKIIDKEVRNYLNDLIFLQTNVSPAFIL